MDKEALSFLERLCDSNGPAGFERETTILVKDYIERYADSMCTDRTGDLVFAHGKNNSPKVMVAGHVDEIGMIVTSISDEGFLSFQPLGSWSDLVLLGQKVNVMTGKGVVKAVIASRPPHVTEPGKDKAVPLDAMLLDVGASNRWEAEAMGIRMGDAVAPDSKFFTVRKKRFRNGKPDGEATLAFGKALDNRVGAFLTAELVRTLAKKKIDHPNQVIGAATVQEEVGSRGALTVANMVRPDVMIALDVDVAGDVPGILPSQAPSHLGDGVTITVWDFYMIPNQPLKELCIEICESKGIPYQLSQSKGWTDAGVVHTTGIGVPAIALGPPVRHIHTHVGIVDLADVEATLQLTLELIKVLDKKTVDSLTSIAGVKSGL